MERNEAINEIRKALRERSGKTWSVTGGRGTVWGWIHIEAPPSRKVNGQMTDEDRAELSRLLGKDVHFQGENVPASSDYRQEIVARARGETPTVIGKPYWD